LSERKLIAAQREGINLSFGCAPAFTRRSVGYANLTTFAAFAGGLMAKYASAYVFVAKAR
jgi:hypothetical protein